MVKTIRINNTFILIMAILGLATFVSLFFMSIVFTNERLGLMPYLSVSAPNSVSPYEDALFLVSTVISSFFIALLVIYLLLTYTKRKRR